MTDKTKSLLYTPKSNNFRYSQSSLNSNENSEIDYNLYCFSQGYKNREKGYWRGVLRNKNIDFDLRFNKEWNRRIELEDDDLEKTLYSLNKSELKFPSLDKSSNEYISFVNDNEIGWDSGRFQNFKKIQLQAGVKKQKNKEWLLSNGIKRGTVGVELRTQNYKQFEASEKNKELKKTILSNKTKPQEENIQYPSGQIYEYAGNKWTADKLQKSLNTASDTLNTYNTLSSSANAKDQRGAYTRSSQGKRIEPNFIGQSITSDSTSKNIKTENNYDQYKRQKFDKSISSANIEKEKGYDINKSRKGIQTKSQAQSQTGKYGKINLNQSYNYNIKGKEYGYDKPTSYGTNYSSNKKDRKEFKYGQKETDVIVKKTSNLDRPENLGRMEISVEKKKKEKPERKPRSRSNERLIGSKKRKISYDKDGKPLKNTSRLNVSTEKKKKEKREKLENIGRLEVSAGKKKKEESITRKPVSRKHSRIHSSKKKRKESYDSEGRPLTNTNRLVVNLSKKKEKKERLDNYSRLEVSAEKKKKDRPSRKPVSRKHDRVLSSKKKRKESYDSEGRPLTNTNRLVVNLSKKKEKKERLNNYSRLEVSAEKKKKSDSITREPGPRKHDRVLSSKKKRKESYDSEGRPLTNTSRLNVNLSKKKEKKEKLDNFSKLEVSLDKDREVSYKKSGSFDKKPRISYKPEKDSITKKPLKIKGTVDKNYDIKRQKTEPYKYDQSPYLRNKPQQTLQPTYTKTQTSQNQKQPSYISSKLQQNIQPSYSGTKAQPQLSSPYKQPSYIKTKAGQTEPTYSQYDYSKYNKEQSYTDKKSKESPKISSRQIQPTYGQYDSSKFNKGQSYTDKKTKEMPKIGSGQTQRTYGQYDYSKYNKGESYIDKKSKETPKIGSEQTQPTYGQYDYSKYNKGESYTDKKSKESEKIEDKYKVQKPTYVNKSSLGQKLEKLKDYRKQQTTYDTQKLTKGSISSERLIDSQKRKISYDKDGKTLKNTSNIKNKPYGIAPDYQQYSLGSRTQQQGFDKGTNVSYGISSSQLNTASTIPRDSKHRRMNKSVEGSMEFYSGDTIKNNTIYQSSSNQKPYGQSTSSLYTQPKYTQTKDKKKDVSTSERFLSAPKKPIQVSSSTKPKAVESGYLQTPTQKQKLDQYKRDQQSQQNVLNKYKTDHPSVAKGKSYLKTETYSGQKNKKEADNIKLDLSKYLQDKTPQSKKQKDKKSNKQAQEIEIYEYYPLSKTATKPDTYNKQKQTSSSSNKYQSKPSKIDKNKTPKTTTNDNLYEYNPVTKIFEYKPKKSMEQRKGVAQSTEPGYKGSLNRSTTSSNLMKNKPMSINLDKYTYDRTKPDSYLTTLPKKPIKTTSYSYQKDKIVTYADNTKGSQPKNDRYLFSPFSDENKNNELQRTHGIQSTSSNIRHSIAFFKCKFLTTKEVCEKFWKSIDTGELSSLMFEPNGFSTRNSGNASSKLSNFLSPDKNRFSKFSNKNSNSNENTEYTAKNLKNYSGLGKNKGMSYSNSEANFKNFGDSRHSYKVGNN